MKTEQFKLDSQALRVLGAIRSIGARPLLVGGCVRDAIMGQVSKDVDVEVHGLQRMDTLLDALRQVGRVDEVGKSFGVLKIGNIDVSLPRRDSKVSEGHRGFTIVVDPTMTLEESAARRDFTMNAIMFDPFAQTIIDPFDGQHDIENHTLRHTSAAFAEDPLRVLRGIQFAARFGFHFAEETAELCQSLVDTFSELATERVWAEWEKILQKGTHVREMLAAISESGWGVHFPEFAKIEGDRTYMVATTPCAAGTERHMQRVLAAMIVESGLQSIRSIGAPYSIRKPAETIAREVAVLHGVVTHGDVKRLARRLGSLSILDVGLVAQSEGDPVVIAAGELGVLRRPLKPFISGTDLIERGMEPGPDFTPILRTALELQDEGEFATREDALAWLDKTITK